jgi:hypothetical protein
MIRVSIAFIAITNSSGERTGRELLSPRDGPALPNAHAILTASWESVGREIIVTCHHGRESSLSTAPSTARYTASIVLKEGALIDPC